ncbi:MAG: GntR family transcriptional regulator [Candidatus Dormibacteraceae bacterium]
MERTADPELIRLDARSDQIARLLFGSILDRRLRPGDEVPGKMRVAARYRATRAVPREALRRLAALNMIQPAKGKLPVVKPIHGDLLRVYSRRSVERAAPRRRGRLRRGHQQIVAPIIDQDPELARRRMDDDLRGDVAAGRADGHR